MLNYQIIKHPKWNMGSKLSVDSSTMMNKVFEIIEAKKIFDLNIKKIKYFHPKSYVHAIVKFKNGLTKILIHDTNMKIPIFNTLHQNQLILSQINLIFQILNNLNLKVIDNNTISFTKYYKIF